MGKTTRDEVKEGENRVRARDKTGKESDHRPQEFATTKKKC